MKGKTGNLILTIKEGEAVVLDGPGKVRIKLIKKNKVSILVDADDETNIRREAKERPRSKNVNE